MCFHFRDSQPTSLLKDRSMYISESFAQASCIAAKLAAGIIMVAAAHGALAGYSGDSGGMQKIAFSSKGNNATAAQSHAASACKIINSIAFCN